MKETVRILNIPIMCTVSCPHIKSAKKYIESKMPRILSKKIDVVYFGDFDFLKEKEYSASYIDGAIFLQSSKNNNPESFCKNFFHEIFHSIENSFLTDKLRDEYNKKRDYVVRTLIDFEEFEVDKFFDEDIEGESQYFNRVTQNPSLSYILEEVCQDVFLNIYQLTSFNEYAAVLFQSYFMEDTLDVKIISPVFYEIVNNKMRTN